MQSYDPNLPIQTCMNSAINCLILSAFFLSVGCSHAGPANRYPAANEIRSESCVGLLKKLVGNKKETIWADEKPLFVELDGKALPIQLSYDAEITHHDIYKRVLKDPELTKEFEDLVEKHLAHSVAKNKFLSIFGLSREPFRIRLDDLAEILKASPKQVKAFHIRKNIDTDKDSFRITDLNPRAFDLFFDELFFKLYKGESVTGFSLPPKPAQRLFTAYKNFVNRMIQGDEFESVATQDLIYIELAYKGSTNIPSKFSNDLANRVWTHFPSASAHMHLGIPSELGDEKFLSIARALEARIILQLARETLSSSDSRLAYSSYTVLESEPELHFNKLAIAARGVIRATANRFTDPVPAYDLELRQYTSHAEGLSNLELGTQLIQKHDQLIPLPNDYWKGVSQSRIDPWVGNIHEALRYVSYLLKNRARPEDIELAKQIDSHRIAIGREAYTDEQRESLAQSLRRIDFDEFFGEDLFLAR